MRKIKYKKGKKVQPTFLDYTGVHKQIKTEMQLFVYDTDDLTEYKEFDKSQLDKCFESSKVNWLNIHGLNDTEVIKFTHHPKIKIARVQGFEQEYITEQFALLEECHKSQDDFKLVSQIKVMVKEYVSNNSVYQSLDN